MLKLKQKFNLSEIFPTRNGKVKPKQDFFKSDMTRQVATKEEQAPAILEEIVIEEVGIDGMCGVY
ncbi:MAG: variant-type mycofactocin precursor [Ardenticatenaceae bacterium]